MLESPQAEVKESQPRLLTPEEIAEVSGGTPNGTWARVPLVSHQATASKSATPNQNW